MNTFSSFAGSLVLLSFSVTTALAAELTPEAKMLSELVSISSGTLDIKGVTRVQEHMRDQLKSIGFDVELVQNPDGANKSGKALVATLKGESSDFITLVGHADTVFEKLNPFTVSADGKTAKGSGVVDEKGGLVVGFFAAKEFAKKHRLSLRMVISPAEETGSAGFLPLFKSFANDSYFIAGLEPSLDHGDYLSSRKGVRWYEIEVVGKESHGGAKHELGINACHDLAVKLDRLQRLTDYSKGNTVNIGHMEGGKDKFNIVCGSARAKVDTRFANEEESKKLAQKVEAILNEPVAESASTHEKSVTHFKIVEETPPLPLSPSAKNLMGEYVKIIHTIEGIDIQGLPSGGAGDLNYMYVPGKNVVDGFGPNGGGMHTAEEFVRLDTLVTRSKALLQFLQYLDSNYGK